MTSFSIAYAVFEIPAGAMGDLLGPRRTLIRIVAWWSVCTALTAAVGLRVGGLLVGGLGPLIALPLPLRRRGGGGLSQHHAGLSITGSPRRSWGDGPGPGLHVGPPNRRSSPRYSWRFSSEGRQLPPLSWAGDPPSSSSA